MTKNSPKDEFKGIADALKVLRIAQQDSSLQRAIDLGLITADEIVQLAQVPERREQLDGLVGQVLVEATPIAVPELVGEADLRARVNKFIDKCLNPNFPVRRRTSNVEALEEFKLTKDEKIGRLILERLVDELNANSSIDTIYRLVAMLHDFPRSVGGEFGGLAYTHPAAFLCARRISSEIKSASFEIIGARNEINDPTLNYLAESLGVIVDTETYLRFTRKEYGPNYKFTPDELKELFLAYLEIRMRDLSRP